MAKNFIYFGDTAYRIDLDAYCNSVVLQKTDDTHFLEKEIKVVESNNGEKETTTTDKMYPKETVVNSVKSDLLKYFVDVVMDSTETIEVDDPSLGVVRALEQTSLSFKIAFNTLINENILVEIDE